MAGEPIGPLLGPEMGMGREAARLRLGMEAQTLSQGVGGTRPGSNRHSATPCVPGLLFLPRRLFGSHVLLKTNICRILVLPRKLQDDIYVYNN